MEKIIQPRYLYSLVRLSNKVISQLDPFNQLEQIHNNCNYHAEGKNPKFNSNFESGNLLFALKSQTIDNQYDLVLQNDINTRGFTQWFYFSISQVPLGISIKFNIINLSKSDSLFNYGLLPAVFSQKKFKKCGIGWHRAGNQVSYNRSNLKRQQSKRYYYKLTFSYQFKYQKDIVYFAHSYPYTYLNYKQFIKPILQHPLKSKLIRQSKLCQSLGGHKVDLLTIQQNRERKKVILILCRQHAGQTPSSFVLQGIINFLLNNKSKEAEFIRKKYCVKIIPFVNIDGVVIGNYRCGLSGSDPNRRWDTHRKDLFPEIIAIKKIAQELSKDKKLKLVIDLHGHSRKMRSFFYGNPYYIKQLPRVLPLICSRINPDISFYHSNFISTIDKMTTARSVLGKIANPAFVTTFQTSFYGTIRQQKKKHFSEDDMRKIGWDLFGGVYHLLYQDFLQQRKISQHGIFAKTFIQLTQNRILCQVGSNIQQDSDSDPQEYCVQKQIIDNLLQLRQTKTLPSSSEYTRRKFISIKQSKYQKKHNTNIRLVQMCKGINNNSSDNRVLGLQPVYLNAQQKYFKKKERKIASSVSRRPTSNHRQKIGVPFQLFLQNQTGITGIDYKGLHSTKSYSMHSAQSINMRQMILRNGRGQNNGLTKSHLLQVIPK